MARAAAAVTDADPLLEKGLVSPDARVALVLAEMEAFADMDARRDGIITGAEALIRWRHPVRGIIPPGKFSDPGGIAGAPRAAPSISDLQPGLPGSRHPTGRAIL